MKVLVVSAGDAPIRSQKTLRLVTDWQVDGLKLNRVVFIFSRFYCSNAAVSLWRWMNQTLCFFTVFSPSFSPSPTSCHDVHSCRCRRVKPLQTVNELRRSISRKILGFYKYNPKLITQYVIFLCLGINRCCAAAALQEPRGDKPRCMAHVESGCNLLYVFLPLGERRYSQPSTPHKAMNII